MPEPISAEQLAVAIPSQFYYVAGALIVANLSSILAFLWGGIRLYTAAIIWKTTTDHRLDKNEKDIQNAWNSIKGRDCGKQ